MTDDSIFDKAVAELDGKRVRRVKGSASTVGFEGVASVLGNKSVGGDVFVIITGDDGTTMQCYDRQVVVIA